MIALLALGVAIYITAVEGGGGAPKCLAGGHGCETVARSHYAHLAGINVAAIGIFGDLLLLTAALVPGDAGRYGGFLTALIAFGFSAYLTYLELFVVDAICEWCVAHAVLIALSLAVAAARALAYTGRELRVPPLESASDGR